MQTQILLAALCCFAAVQQPGTSLSTYEMFEVWEDHQAEIIAHAHANTHAREDMTQAEAIYLWLESEQPRDGLYAGPIKNIRDRIRERIDNKTLPDDGTIDEPKERKDRRRKFDPDKKRLIEIIQDGAMDRRSKRGTLTKSLTWLVVALVVAVLVVRFAKPKKGTVK